MLRFMVLAVGIAASPAAAGVHPPDVEARLRALVGDWTIRGQESTYRERCEWYGDRAFVVCNAEDASDNSASQSILGYSRADGHYTYYNFGNGGTGRSEVGFAHGERGLAYTSERRTPSGLVRTTSILTPAANGSLHFRQDRSTNGGEWSMTVEFDYVLRANQ